MTESNTGLLSERFAMQTNQLVSIIFNSRRHPIHFMTNKLYSFIRLVFWWLNRWIVMYMSDLKLSLENGILLDVLFCLNNTIVGNKWGKYTKAHGLNYCQWISLIPITPILFYIHFLLLSFGIDLGSTTQDPILNNSSIFMYDIIVSFYW